SAMHLSCGRGFEDSAPATRTTNTCNPRRILACPLPPADNVLRLPPCRPDSAAGNHALEEPSGAWVACPRCPVAGRLAVPRRPGRVGTLRDEGTPTPGRTLLVLPRARTAEGRPPPRLARRGPPRRRRRPGRRPRQVRREPTPRGGAAARRIEDAAEG